jgi:hypothetical protein
MSGSVMHNLNIPDPPTVGLIWMHESALLASDTGTSSGWHCNALWEAHVWHGSVERCVSTDVLTLIYMAA